MAATCTTRLEAAVLGFLGGFDDDYPSENLAEAAVAEGPPGRCGTPPGPDPTLTSDKLARRAAGRRPTFLALRRSVGGAAALGF